MPQSSSLLTSILIPNILHHTRSQHFAILLLSRLLNVHNYQYFSQLNLYMGQILVMTSPIISKDIPLITVNAVFIQPPDSPPKTILHVDYLLKVSDHSLLCCSIAQSLVFRGIETAFNLSSF